MNLSGGWSCEFIDDTHQVILKKHKGPSQVRTVHMRYDEPFMKLVDPQGNHIVERWCRISPKLRNEVLAACRERWG